MPTPSSKDAPCTTRSGLAAFIALVMVSKFLVSGAYVSLYTVVTPAFSRTSRMASTEGAANGSSIVG